MQLQLSLNPYLAKMTFFYHTIWTGLSFIATVTENLLTEIGTL